MKVTDSGRGPETKWEIPGKQIVVVIPACNAVKTVAMNRGGNPTKKDILKELTYRSKLTKCPCHHRISCLRTRNAIPGIAWIGYGYI